MTKKAIGIIGSGLPVGKIIEMSSEVPQAVQVNSLTGEVVSASPSVAHEVHVHLCDVCKKNEMHGVYSSSCGPISFAYCLDCATRGAEPYGALVAYISGAYGLQEWDLPESQERYRHSQLVYATLDVAGKTFEDFIVSVRQAILAYDEYEQNLPSIEEIEKLSFPE